MTAAQRLDFWWWGEDEAPGLGDWLERKCTTFATRRNVEVRRRLLRHDEVLPGFPAAAEAGRAPDLHFFWNGIYVVESVWRGFVVPLDGLLDPDELAAIGSGAQSRVDGRTYRAGWYVIPVVWVANRAVLAAAGVERLPTDWNELVDACEAARAAGFTPLIAGDGEGDVSVWWLTHFLTQALDEPEDIARLILGELDWREPRFSEHWLRLDEIRRAGFVDEASLGRTLWNGLARFNEGRAAFTLASGPMFLACRKALGQAATVMVAPRAGCGQLAGLPIVDTQGIGISSDCAQPELAAAFIAHLHDAEGRSSLWETVRLFPADSRWDGPGASADADYARMWEWYARGPSAPYVPNLIPLELHYRLAAEVGQAVVRGQLSGDEAGDLAWARSRDWREANPTRAEIYRDWVLSAARGATEGRGGEHAKT